MSVSIIPFKRRLAARGGAGAQGSAGPAPREPAPTPLSPAQALRFRETILPHLDSAYSLARYLCRDAVAADDITQEAMLKAFRGFGGFRGAEPKAWLLAIVRNAVVDWSRRRRGWEDLSEADDLPGDDQPSPEETLIRQGDAAALRRAIEAIPQPFCEALILRDLEDMSYKQIAEITGVPLGTVMSRLARARAMLGRAMGLPEEVAR